MSKATQTTITLGQLKDSLPQNRFGDARVVGDSNTVINGLEYDSRLVVEGSLFVALRGNNVDGHSYLTKAIELGASVAMVEKAWLEAQSTSPLLPLLVVENTRQALPFIASAFYGAPSESFDLIGVTGTNGKTSITYMIDAIMRRAGFKSAVLGTVGVQVDSEPLETHWSVSTTPESCDLQALFAQFKADDVQVVSVEVTSIAIDQERTACCAFDTVVFSNLTHDHLDYHGTLEEYTHAKERLFSQYVTDYAKPGCTASINLDDPVGQRFVDAIIKAGGRALTYGIDRADADIVAKVLDVHPTSTHIKVSDISKPGQDLEFELGVGGLFNVSNALAAICVARLRGTKDEFIVDGLSMMGAVPGRFESVPTNGHDFDVIVDYAHTADGLENVLRSARRLDPKRLIVVFGCGGNRDTKKRPIMGKIAVDLADRVIVTSDNPRKEDPNAIIQDILAGIDQAGSNRKVVIQPDRRAAIEAAIVHEAKTGDLVVIAGKGHETYQLVGDQVLDFDDRKVAAEVLSR